MATSDLAILDAVRSTLGAHPRVVLAVSGGLDSMSLLDAAARAVDADKLVIATFDHGTGKAAREAVRLVQSRASSLGIACESARANKTLRSEAELRRARWDFLRHIAQRFDARVATAHTADDQLETVLMRVIRGAGARGLAGLYAAGGPLRPFLQITRGQLETYARDRRLQFVNDPSNDSPLFFRNRVRHDLLPALRRARPAIARDLLRVSEAAAVWRSDVDAFVADHIPFARLSASRSFEVTLSPLAGMSPAELSVLWPAIAAKFGLILDRRGIARLSAFTIGGRVGSRIQLSSGWSAVRSRDGVTVSASSDLALATASATIDPSGQTLWGAWSFRRSELDPDAKWSSRLPSDAILTVRAWQPGDRMRSTSGSYRKVKQFLSRAGVTGHKRAGWPVVLAGDEIVWIPGVRRSNITERLGTAGLPFICEFIDR